MKVLIAEDTPVDLEILHTFCQRQGFTVVTAENGARAVEAFAETSPDLVLMDVMMPVMDGYEATSRIKSLCVDRWVPVILVTGRDEEQDLAKGVASGADDYLTKPLNLTILAEKIKVMCRITEMQQALRDSVRELKQYQDRSEEELRLAKGIMDKVLLLSQISREIVEWWILPANEFSGDVITAAATPSGKIYLMLADATGHGLPAALIVLHLTQIFYGMSKKGMTLESIAEELNWRIHTRLPTGHFVVASLASIDLDQAEIAIWNGGNPPASFINRQGQILHRWESNHLPLGILNREDFNARLERYQCEEPGQIVICSDGLLEARSPDGREYGADRLNQVLRAASPEARFSSVKETIQAHLGGMIAHDDISLIVVHCDSVADSTKPRPEARGKRELLTEETSSWKLKVDLGPLQIKSLDILTVLLDWVNLMNMRKAHSGPIFVILSELYSNALDRGLLQLDSRLKLAPGGFNMYMQERQRRLATLTQGCISIELGKVKVHDRWFLEIRVKDTGPGFDHETLLRSFNPEDIRIIGCGIPLVKSLCSKLEYLGHGNEAVARYRLD